VAVRDSLQDLGGHVGQGAADGSGSLVTAQPLGEAEVANLNM
jgi:hypothetical protein